MLPNGRSRCTKDDALPRGPLPSVCLRHPRVATLLFPQTLIHVVSLVARLWFWQPADVVGAGDRWRADSDSSVASPPVSRSHLGGHAVPDRGHEEAVAPAAARTNPAADRADVDRAADRPRAGPSHGGNVWRVLSRRRAAAPDHRDRRDVQHGLLAAGPQPVRSRQGIGATDRQRSAAGGRPATGADRRIVAARDRQAAGLSTVGGVGGDRATAAAR